MATNLDPESEFDSPTTPIRPRSPSLQVQVRDAGAEPTGEAEECRTPTSEERRIPRALSCPAPPRKPKTKPAVPCKRARSLDQLEFFEAAGRGEIEGFFRSCDGEAVADVAKRRRFFCK